MPEADVSFGVNRAMRFGDGLFETIKVINGEPHLWSAHMERLKEGMNYLKLSYDPLFFDELLVDAHSLLLQKEIKKGGRLRVMVYRSGKGTYSPEKSSVDYLIEADLHTANGFELNKKGLKVEIAQEEKIVPERRNAFKTLNAIPYVRASLEKQERGFDDLLIQNTEGKIIEATSSNLFIFKSGKWITPPIEDGCLNGVMRSWIMDNLSLNGLSTLEQSIRVEDVLMAEEVFLTNAIQGIKWVSAFRDKRFYRRKVEEIFKRMNQGFQ